MSVEVPISAPPAVAAPPVGGVNVPQNAEGLFSMPKMEALKIPSDDVFHPDTTLDFLNNQTGVLYQRGVPASPASPRGVPRGEPEEISLEIESPVAGIGEVGPARHASQPRLQMPEHSFGGQVAGVAGREVGEIKEVREVKEEIAAEVIEQKIEELVVEKALAEQAQTVQIAKEAVQTDLIQAQKVEELIKTAVGEEALQTKLLLKIEEILQEKPARLASESVAGREIREGREVGETSETEKIEEKESVFVEDKKANAARITKEIEISQKIRERKKKEIRVRKVGEIGKVWGDQQETKVSGKEVMKEMPVTQNMISEVILFSHRSQDGSIPKLIGEVGEIREIREGQEKVIFTQLAKKATAVAARKKEEKASDEVSQEAVHTVLYGQQVSLN